MTFRERLTEFFTPKSYYKDLYEEEKEKNSTSNVKLAEVEKTNTNLCKALFYDGNESIKNEFFKNLITSGQKEIARLNACGITLFDKSQKEVVDINDIEFVWGWFDRTTFQNVTFNNIMFDDVSFKESNFKNIVEFNNCIFGHCNFAKSDFKDHTTFNNCEFGYCDFTKANFRENISFNNCKFLYTDFSEAVSNNNLTFTNCSAIIKKDSKGNLHHASISDIENKNNSLIIDNCKETIDEDYHYEDDIVCYEDSHNDLYGITYDEDEDEFEM